MHIEGGWMIEIYKKDDIVMGDAVERKRIIVHSDLAAYRSTFGSLRLMPTIASPSPALTSARMVGSL